MAQATEQPNRSKRALLDESDSESEDGGAPITDLKVNQDFARRFEHNKKREERQRLEEKGAKTGKAGNDDDDDGDSSSSDESEDEDGFLATEDLDAQISATLKAIRNKDPKVYDKDIHFYAGGDGPSASTDKEKKEKPVYLKDYHREKLLKGDVGASDDEDDAPKTYVQEQNALKKSILSEINAATAGDSDDEDEDDDGFIVKKKKGVDKTNANGVHPARQAGLAISELDVEKADKDPENFLSNFMSARAWVQPDGSNWKAFESDDGEDDDQADEFEQAYNMRFEDPEKSNEVLRTYARDIANAKSVRREEKTGRKRQRELEREEKETEKQQRREEKARLRKLKLDEAEKKLRKIKKAAGNVGKELKDEDWVKFLDDAWDNDKWEEEMLRRFGDDYYAQADDGMPISDDDDDEADAKKKKKKKAPKKPTWDDDIDIKDLVPGFEDEEKPEVGLSDAEGDAAEDIEDEEDDQSRPSKKRKTADHKKVQKEAQKKARQDRTKLEALVDAKLGLSDHDILKTPANAAFRYRETSPESFGMTARDILLAPSDQVLNEFAGLKKLATFRDDDKKRRDRKTLGKKHRLRQWRREAFGTEFEQTGPTYGFERVIDEDEVAASGKIVEAEAKDSNVVGETGGSRKKRKRSKNKKGGAAVKADD